MFGPFQTHRFLAASKRSLVGSLKLATFGVGFALAMIGSAQAANFTPGNLVVVRIGDGTTVLTNAAAPVFLDEYTPAGVLVQSIALPTSTTGSNSLFTNSGTATSEGFLNVSTNGQYLICGGYGAAVGTINVAQSASINAPRVVARITVGGLFDTTTALTDAFSGGNLRSVASDNGSQFWLAGNAEGVRYAAFGATTSAVVSQGAPTNLRVLNIDAGQLYTSSASGTTQGVATVGSGLSSSPGQIITPLTGFPTTTGPGAYDYFFADPNTLYVADDRVATSGGGIQKWTQSAGTWTHVYTLNNGTNGCRGLHAVMNGGVATLYATTAQSTLNTIITVTDTGAGSAVTTIATATTNMIFRGLRTVPGGSSGTGTPICFGDGSGTACPCANTSPVGNNEGCLSSLAVGGKLVGSGTPSLAADTVVLSGSQMPNSSALYFQGTTQIAAGLGAMFGDGLRCAGGSVVRLGTKLNAAGASQYPAAGDASVSVKGLVGSPGQRTYQIWYRNAAAFCTISTFNLSNGLTIVWLP